MKHGGRFKDLTGMRFGRLLVVRYSHRGKKVSMWDCKCVCGKTKVVASGNLLRKNKSTKSCGCFASDHLRSISTKHGAKSGKIVDQEYRTWSHMLERCRYSKHPHYKHYGGRGIKVCERWKKYENFLSDMGRNPSPIHTIDRIDVNGDYCPENCRWETIFNQQSNRRNNRMISFNGDTRTVAQWERIAGLTKGSLNYRLNKGWSIEKAITLPLDAKKQRFNTSS